MNIHTHTGSDEPDIIVLSVGFSSVCNMSRFRDEGHTWGSSFMHIEKGFWLINKPFSVELKNMVYILPNCASVFVQFTIVLIWRRSHIYSYSVLDTSAQFPGHVTEIYVFTLGRLARYTNSWIRGASVDSTNIIMQRGRRVQSPHPSPSNLSVGCIVIRHFGYSGAWI